MSELPKKIEQSEKYPNETSSIILGNCYDTKTTAGIVHQYNCHDDLAEELADYKEGCEGLKMTIQDIRPYADCYKRVCKNLGIEKDILGYIKNLQDCHDDLVAIKKTIQDESDELDARIAEGKHNDAWPNPDYIKDEDWAGMIDRNALYHHVLRLFEAALENAKVKK